MPREFNPTRNVLEIEDKISGDVLTIYYKLPANHERIAYSNAFIQRKGNVIVAKADAVGIQASFGAKIITGFKKGDFTLNGDVIASEPSDPDYCKDWKEFMTHSASDILAYLARTVFESLSKPAEQLDFVVENLANPDPPESPEAPAQEPPSAEPQPEGPAEAQADPLS